MRLSVFILLCICLTTIEVEAKKHILYVGTYTKGITNGIFVYQFNDKNGKLSDLKMPVVSSNPSYLTISASKDFLYAVGEQSDLGNDKSGGVSAFRIEHGGKNTGKLTLINHVLSHGANPCHVCVSPNNKWLVASNYTGGKLSFFNILPDGSLTDTVKVIQHTGSGPFPGRQTEPHVHSAQFDKSGKLVYAADLGIDEVRVYRLSNDGKSVMEGGQPVLKLPAGSGPRHFDFSPDGRFVYVINELSSTITVFMKYGNEWKDIQNIKTYPKEFKGETWCADIHLSVDGRFVYGSNRGHNSIAVFSRDKTSGKLELIQTISVEGNWPRNFTLDPSGDFLLVANQKSNDITVFRIDSATGKLKFTGIKVSNESPVCLKFL